ncbi:Orotidine 5'-phosphate decarboxylase [Chitinispirillum alkaliphilum]|nr:Orotidine 5'-phosphate decarboxylase [Chitinispirillum alkaliphilum]
MKNSRDYLALALDNFDKKEDLTRLIELTSDHIGVYKLGLEQFTRFGPAVLDAIRTSGRNIFLDLKFHDIPNTVAKAVKSACSLDVDILTIHTQGGVEMMKAAMSAAKEYGKENSRRPKIIGVTLLTSISQQMLNEDLQVEMKTEQYVKHLAQKAVLAGLDGLVCSAADLPVVKPVLPEDFLVVTPGIRPQGSDKGDQQRVATPEWAIQNGATLLVVGRPITGAGDPGRAAEEIVKQIGS